MKDVTICEIDGDKLTTAIRFGGNKRHHRLERIVQLRFDSR